MSRSIPGHLSMNIEDLFSIISSLEDTDMSVLYEYHFEVVRSNFAMKPSCCNKFSKAYYTFHESCVYWLKSVMDNKFFFWVPSLGDPDDEILSRNLLNPQWQIITQSSMANNLLNHKWQGID